MTIHSGFEWKQQSVPVWGVDFDDSMLQNRMNAATNAITSSLSMSLYGDDPAKPQPNRWERIRRSMSVYRTRVRDAWLVLTGQAEIGYY